MPLIDPTSETINDILVRLIALLTADSGTTNLFTFPIRRMMPDGLYPGDDVTVAIYSPDGDLMPNTLGTIKISPRVIMVVTIAESKGLSAAGVEALYIRLMKITGTMQQLVWKYRVDPTAGDKKWWALRFRQGPTYTFERRPQEFQRTLTHFDIRTEKANP